MDIVIKICYLVIIFFEIIVLGINWNATVKSTGKKEMDYTPLNHILLVSFAMAIYMVVGTYGG